MKETRTPEQLALALEKTIAHCRQHGWTHKERWLFRSPSGTVHDLSAADLTMLDYIERNRTFVV